MDVFATDGSFSVAMGGLDSCLYAWDKKDNSLVVQKNSKAKYPHDFVSIQTNRGDFIEAVNGGNEVVWRGGDGEWCHVPIGKKPIKLRFRDLPKPDLSKNALEAARKKVTRYLYSDSPYSLGVNGKLGETITILQKKLNEIPKACRDTAKIEFRDRMSYGESYEHVEITYEEPETDDELIWRLTVEAERARIDLAKKKATLKKLQTELESQS